MAARKIVTGLALNCRRDMTQWTSAEMEAVDVVSRVWQMAATFDEEGVLPKRFLETGYGGTIVRHWNVCAPYVRDLRVRTNSNSQRIGFERMAERFIAMGL